MSVKLNTRHSSLPSLGSMSIAEAKAKVAQFEKIAARAVPLEAARLRKAAADLRAAIAHHEPKTAAASKPTGTQTDDLTPQLQGAFEKLGHTSESARIMAAGRRGRPVAARSMTEAGAALGLSPAAARTFARGHGIREAAVTKHENPAGAWKGGDFPASDYAFVGDVSDSSTWDLLLTKVPGGEVDPDAIRSAVMAIDPANPNQPNPVPDDAMPDVKAKLAKAWAKALPDEELPASLANEALRRAFRGMGLSETAAAIAARGRGERGR